MGRIEFQGVARNVDVQRNMKIAWHTDTILPTLMPEHFKKYERLEGDGGAGTLKLITLGPAMTGGPEVQIKERTLVFDSDNATIVTESYDPRFSKLQTTARVVPHDNGVDSITLFQIDYEPLDPASPPPEELKVLFLAVMETVQKYVDQHPEWP